MRILIIEDDSLFSEILRTFFEDQKCVPMAAESLADAKALLKATDFDFILLDNHLPDGDGINFLDIINELVKRPTPVMMITAEDNQNIMSESFSKGADDFLVKPISLDLLWQKVQRVQSLYSKEATLAAQKRELDKLLNQRQIEDDLASYVYEHVVSNSIGNEDCIETYIQSSSTFSGDVFISESAPNGNRFVILADATGHGLAAAISILPLINTIKAMIRKGLSLAHIVHEANTKLDVELPDDKFVALCGIEINLTVKQITVFSGGMPDILAIKHDGSIEQIKSTSMALGILPPDDFEPTLTTLDGSAYKNMLILSDGLSEQRNKYGEEYGNARLIQSIKHKAEKDPLISSILMPFMEFNGIQALEDDLSLCDLQLADLLDKQQSINQENAKFQTGKLSASIAMSGGLLTSSDIVGCFDGLMKSIDVAGDLRQRCFTVFAELISNAFDHGILGLESELKNDAEGFAEYISLKDERMGNISEQDSLTMNFDFDPCEQKITFSVIDSGVGYDMDNVKGMEDGALSGRGLPLIHKLCKEVEVKPPGNHTSVMVNREC